MTPPTWHPLGLKTITPAFLGRFPAGAPATRTQIPFPIPSLRGVLAYWLRAVAGPHVGDNIPELLRLESDLFGRPAGTGPSRPSRILLRADRITVGPPPNPTGHLGYLMGPGLTDDDQPPPRRLWPGQLTVDVRNTGTPQHADLFLCALWALRAYGGIGARSRRGFGTLALSRPPSLPHRHFASAWLIRDNTADRDDVLACAAAALHDLDFRKGDFAAAPRYPCFAPDRFRDDERRIMGGNPDDVLGRVGNTLRTLRHPEPAPDWAPPPGRPFILSPTEGYLKVAQPYADNGIPQPSPFTDGALGLPIVYTVEGHDESVTVEPLTDNTSTRRASPLWLRVTALPKGWHLRSLAFHSEWLPKEQTLQVKSTNRNPEPVNKPSPEQIKSRIDEWFNRLPEQV